MKKFFLALSFFYSCIVLAQREPDKIYMPNIQSATLFLAGNQLGYPVIPVGSINTLELHFDDLDGYVKNYSYTYQLCNADWQPVDLSPFDYIKGFSQNRISQYRVSSIAKTKYVHYQVTLPENGSIPIVSGNYLLKVFLNGDTGKLAFTKRLLVAEDVVPIGVQIQQPYNNELFRTHQKVQFSIDKSKLNIMNPQQQLKVVVLQNYRWDDAVTGAQPLFMKPNLYEYNGEKDFIFPAGKEYRWLDLRSFRFLSQRMQSVDKNATPFEVTVAPDPERIENRYLYYEDLNGFYQIASTDLINPWWQGDYAYVHFAFVPKDNIPFPGKSVYIAGQMTDYAQTDTTLMTFNSAKGAYETTLFLKQGYYSYIYLTKDLANPNASPDLADTEGNYWETENNYTVLVYYRSFSDRSDRLVGVTTINSRRNRKGF